MNYIFYLILFGILLLSIYFANLTDSESNIWNNMYGAGCSPGIDGVNNGITNAHSVTILADGAPNLPFPQFRKYWYRNYGEMTDPFYTNYWQTYWNDSDYFKSLDNYIEETNMN